MRAASGTAAGLSGRVRVSASVCFARLYIVPKLSAFLAAHPDVEVDLPPAAAEAYPDRSYEELDRVMSKLKHEAELFKAALLAGIRYAEGRGAVQFEATDSASAKALYVYRLLVHDKLITPMPEDQVGEKTIRHRLATWYAHLPKGHQLLE